MNKKNSNLTQSNVSMFGASIPTNYPISFLMACMLILL